jgi:predicted MFS family arabinose efflux permease
MIHASARRRGGTRRTTIALLSAVLGLQVADTSAVGAMAGPLERGLHISHTGIGALVSASLVVTAVATVPLGVLADRRSRPRLLAAGIAVWCVALVGCAAAPSFGFLLIARLVLGGAAAAAWPAVASLVGDVFPPGDRGRIFGLILSGELLGAGFGFLLSGNIAGALGWRAGFLVLVPPCLALGWAVATRLPEPRDTRREQDDPEPDDDAPEDRFVPVVRRILSVPTNRRLIAASALGYLFLAGEQTFGVEFLQHRYGLGQNVATTLLVGLSAGALLGVLTGGRLADRLMARQHPTARPTVAGVALVVCVVAFGIALALPALWAAAPAYLLAAATLSAANPPLDSARLDVVPGALWARAEGIRSLLRTLAQAAGPLMFGVLADTLGQSGSGLRTTFAIMLVPLLAGAVIVLLTRRSYARDAERSQEAT